MRGGVQERHHILHVAPPGWAHLAQVLLRTASAPLLEPHPPAEVTEGFWTEAIGLTTWPVHLNKLAHMRCYGDVNRSTCEIRRNPVTRLSCGAEKPTERRYVEPGRNPWVLSKGFKRAVPFLRPPLGLQRVKGTSVISGKLLEATQHLCG